MENNEDNLIQMLGTNITVEEINNIYGKENIKQGKTKLFNHFFITYIIGCNITKDIEKFEGKIICIIQIKEKNDVRIVVSDKNSKMTYSEIKGWFRDIEELSNANFNCLYEKSAGVITYKKINNKIKYLIVYSKINFPGFPKGHVEYKETEEEAAKREVFEEVGIKVNLKSNFRESLSYIVYDTPIHKEVVFFLAEISEKDKINIDTNEINKFEFVNLDEAQNILNQELIDILKNTEEYIKNNT